MPNVLSLVQKEVPKKPEESELDYQDRIMNEAFEKLHTKKNRTESEEKEHKELAEKIGAAHMLQHGGLSEHFADKDIKPMVARIHQELASQYGADTPLKRILIERISCAWNSAFSYERMFQLGKYKQNEEGGFSWNYDQSHTAFIKEARRGVESANDQIIRLTQALQNLVTPPIQVRAKNAIIAQNMQINQGASPSDKTHAEAPH